jgi:hypothetical protein
VAPNRRNSGTVAATEIGPDEAGNSVTTAGGSFPAFAILATHGFGSRDLRFRPLDIGFSVILPRYKDKQNRGNQHERSKKRVVICSRQINPDTAEVRFIEINGRGNEIPDADREEPNGHHCALHFSWSLGVGKFETGNRYHHFSSRKQNVPR